MNAMLIPRGVAALALFVVLRALAVTVDANLPADVPNLRWFRAPAEKSAENVKGVLFLEAEGFADYGKWRLDTQFIHKMGSACLIAAGVGKLLEPAVTSVTIPRAGRWTVWARCNDWHPPHSPGRFAVAVGGKEGKILGASGTRTPIRAKQASSRRRS